jgi:hypothetical protein
MTDRIARSPYPLVPSVIRSPFVDDARSVRGQILTKDVR